MIELPLPKLQGHKLEVFEALTGRRPEDNVYDAAGAALSDDCALVKGRDDRGFVVALAVGENVYAIAEYPAFQLKIRNEDLTVFPDSPETIKRKKRDAKREQALKEHRMQSEVALRLDWGCDISMAPGGIRDLRKDEARSPVRGIV